MIKDLIIIRYCKYLTCVLITVQSFSLHFYYRYCLFYVRYKYYYRSAFYDVIINYNTVYLYLLYSEDYHIEMSSIISTNLVYYMQVCSLSI